MKIVILGLTITSSWGNGHATTYRSLCRALAARGHRIFFLEKDVEWYRSNRDLPQPEFCEAELYTDWQEAVPRVLRQIADADLVILGSYFPDGIAAADLIAANARCPTMFYDIDTPITVARLRADGSADYLEARQIAAFDAYLSFTGGPMLAELKFRFGAKRAIPFYCSVDPDHHFRYDLNKKRTYDLSYLGTYSEDRQPKLEDYLCQPACALPNQRFVVAGSQYPPEIAWPDNVARLTHVSPSDHSEFYSSSRFTLNLTRREMVEAGYSPSVRLFEAAACGASILSDPWPGLDSFFAPGEEILLPGTTQAVIDILRNLSDKEIRSIGEAAQARVLQEHTANHRAEQLEQAVELCSMPVRAVFSEIGK